MRWIVTVEVEVIASNQHEANKKLRKTLDSAKVVGYEIIRSRPRQD